MTPHGYLVVDLYSTTSDSVGLERIYFLLKTARIIQITYFISPTFESFEKRNYMESAELQAMHKSKK